MNSVEEHLAHTYCVKCGRRSPDCRQKYCGNGSDKDNAHSWKWFDEASPEFAPIEQKRAVLGAYESYSQNQARQAKRAKLAVDLLESLIEEMIEKQQPITISDKLFDHLMDWKN